MSFTTFHAIAPCARQKKFQTDGQANPSAVDDLDKRRPHGTPLATFTPPL